MHIARPTQHVDVFEIRDVEKLDPVTVFVQDFGPGRGRLTVECYGHAWSVFFGGMSGKTVREFLAGVDSSYLATKLVSGLQRTVTRKESAWTMRIAGAVLDAISRGGTR